MKRKELPKGIEINPLDVHSKIFVWLVKDDGEKVLYGFNRLCVEHGLKTETFWHNWQIAGSPDEVSLSMLQDMQENRGKKPEGWTVDGEWYPSIKDVASLVGRAKSTVMERFKELGRREATFEELARRKKAAGKPREEMQKVTLMPEGRQFTFPELEKMADVCGTELRRRAKGKGYVLWPDDLKRKSDLRMPAQPKPSSFPRNINEVEYHPTQEERAMLRL